MDLVCLGELLMDMFPAELGRPHAEVSAFRPVPGGAPANVAVAAARLGADVAFIGKVGADPFGYHLRDVLAAEGVETSGMRFDAVTRTTMNLLAQPDPDHYDCFFYRNPGADSQLTAAELDRDLLATTRVLHFGSLSLSNEPIRSATWEAVRAARSAGALISFDMNYRPTLWASPDEALAQVEAMIPHMDLLKVNEGELALLARAGAIGRSPEDAAYMPAAHMPYELYAAGLVARGPGLVVVTFGPRGSAFCTRTANGFVPAFAVPTVDATGCGDAFIAGLLVQLLREDPHGGHDGQQHQAVPAPPDMAHKALPSWPGPAGRLTAALRYANAVGALTALKTGVIPALPTAAEVDAFLRQRGIHAGGVRADRR